MPSRSPAAPRPPHPHTSPSNSTPTAATGRRREAVYSSQGGSQSVPLDKSPEAESLVEFPSRNHPAAGDDAGILKFDLERGIEGERRTLNNSERKPGRG